MNRQKKDRGIISITPIVVGIMAFLSVLLFKSGNILDGGEVLKTLVGVWSALLGFLFTAITISLTANNKMIESLKRRKHYQTVLFSYVITSVYFLVAIFISVNFILFNMWGHNIFCLLFGLCAMTFVSLLICLYFLFNIILRGDVG